MNRILVIEDQPQMRKNIVTILTMENFTVLSAENGRLGLELARRETPDLIICDVMMPDLDGYGVLKALREESATADIPFIFLTAKSEKLDIRAGMNFGADDYLTKPVTRDDLLAAIAARLERRRSVDAAHSGRGFQPDFSSPAPLKRLGLTERESEVLLWVSQGKSNAEIGIILGMAEKTVKKHMGNIFEKLGLEGRNAATVRALEVLNSPARVRN
ncbi:MAG TPA: response regulator transcription factor [Verrucomicrobiae bacterium]|nr:response regulator transcription factor [Verrucomicrobiae bacterium]